MPIDQYKLSIEARPLKVLYSKYNTSEITIPLQLVRPLGRVRSKRRSSSEHIKTEKQFPNIGSDENESNVNTLSIKRRSKSEIKMQKHPDGESNKIKKSEHCASGLDGRDISGKDNNTLPHVTRSKTQAFEHRYRIAASRCNSQESPTFKHSNDFNRKIIHLPLFRINLKTYVGETEVSKTVANTRESLRHLMELHKSKMKPANVITANIKNYEFSAPASRTISSKSDGSANGLSLSQPFPAKQALRSSRGRELEKQHSSLVKKSLKFGAYQREIISISKSDTDTKSTSSEKDEPAMSEKCFYKGQVPVDEFGPDDEPDDSMLSVAIRPDTSLTLGSTMHHIDRVIKSPGSDELREISEVFRNSESQSVWPGYEDMQRMRTYAYSRGHKSRMSVSRPETVNGVSGNNQNSSRPSNGYSANTNFHKPVLRYTSKSSTYKLEPIVVPSHTCTECPMCNIYQRDVETPCPPNTPMSSQLHGSQHFMDQESLPPKPYTAGRSSRSPTKLEVLHMSRINVSGNITPSDEQHMMAYMKANG